ncbi:unnamed protein product [Trifolium pratense]|uniref:Uncharacterized protein n=1 Tax=Trifolium pratense TaxID=57577 RepID=A0ACB0JYB3_TRIPR|nr:unnamed protein product [Trifolium pratense]
MALITALGKVLYCCKIIVNYDSNPTLVKEKELKHLGNGDVNSHNFSCGSLRKGIFIAEAVFIFATMILKVYYYMYFTKATTTPLSQKTNRVSSSVGMTGDT